MISTRGKKEITLREDNNIKCISVGMLYNLRPKQKYLEVCSDLRWMSLVHLRKWKNVSEKGLAC